MNDSNEFIIFSESKTENVIRGFPKVTMVACSIVTKFNGTCDYIVINDANIVIFMNKLMSQLF